ncbi:hypothetical protein BT96DRAFT_1008618 [Gymnopus androsaceus JB14]|uniref:Uncharacterized protein n=1 Tax=Gymnopus androsaceus JB14 TaxID=1447944 RepID=A0A6A4GEY1_9AGAR|nr:hypothetical protein BT96DRAFT_1008618 [Gymnopus androsaceus JB14]
MSASQLSLSGAPGSLVSSSKLFSIVLMFLPREGQYEQICPQDELSKHGPRQRLLGEEDPQKTENQAWNSYIGPILGFKLYTVLSGSSSVQGKIPRSAMSSDLTNKLIRIAKVITEKDGWPTIFEEAVIARWNTNTPVSGSRGPIITKQSSPQNVSQKAIQSKALGNIIHNIQLAASYLSIMTLGVVDVPMDKDFPAQLEKCLQNADFQTNGRFSNILTTLNLSLVEFQAPLFSCLAISPILLFRTCQLQSSRFGRQYYISFMMSLGDIKPASLREIETLIWRNLYLVAQCQLSAEEMMD